MNIEKKGMMWEEYLQILHEYIYSYGNPVPRYGVQFLNSLYYL